MSLTADHEDAAAPAAALAKPNVNISVITPKPGKFEEFMSLQLAQLESVRGKVRGLLGTRMFRSLDNSAIVLVATFETAEDADRWRADDRFTVHLARARPLIERASPGAFETAYEVGVV